MQTQFSGFLDLKWVLPLLLTVSSYSSPGNGLTVCGIAVANPSVFFQAPLQIILAGPRKKPKAPQARILEISDAFRGVVQESLKGEVLSKKEIAALQASSGRNVICNDSSSLTLITQDAINTIIEYAKLNGLSDSQIQMGFNAALTELFGESNSKNKTKAPRGTSHHLVPLLNGFQITSQNTLLRFPLNQDAVFASTLSGEIFRLELSSQTKRSSPLWERVYPVGNTDPVPQETPLNFAVSSNGEYLAVDADGQLSALNMKEDRELWKTESAGKKALNFSPEGEHFVTLSDTDPLQIYSATDGLLHSLKLKWNSEAGVRSFLRITHSAIWPKGEITSARFTPGGNHLILKTRNDSDFNLKLDSPPTIRPIWNLMGISHAKIWGTFFGNRLVSTDHVGRLTLTKIDTGESWHPLSNRQFRISKLAADEKRGLVYLYGTNHQILPVQVDEDFPSLDLLPAFDSGKVGTYVSSIAISPNGFLLAIQSANETAFWNVRDITKPKRLKTTPHTFPDDKKMRQFGFSGSNRFFSGITSGGNFMKVDLSEFHGGTRQP